jgi:peptidoglycan/LPS O-acetylase OafA/YrhL
MVGSSAVSTVPAASVTSTGAAPLKYVPALDGARGVAIALVLAYHFGIPGIPGGFLGVDLFFVLSGFLITTLLLDEHRATGRIDFVQFWYRRARRLLPALFLLVAVVAAWTALVASPVEKGPLRWDLLASLGYVANWRFALAGQSYFAESITASPLRHLWSLAIEEQFYVIWPLLAFGALAWLRAREGSRWQAAALLLVVGAIGSSALMALTYREADPSMAYYNTLARAHELLVGAFAAVTLASAPRVRAAVARRSGPLAAAGLVLVLVAAAVIGDRAAGYYQGGSLLFSFAAAGLIVSLVVGRGHGVQRALSMRPIVLLGVISYGVYLWHWPMTVWLRPDTTGLDGVPLFLLRLGSTLIVAWASFVLVEQPIRRGRLGRVRLRPGLALAAALLGILVLATGSVLATRGWRPPPAFLSDQMVLQVHEVDDAHGTIGIIGDSVALSIYPGMWRVGESRGLTTVSAAVAGCGVGSALRTESDGSLQWKTEECAESIPALQRELVRNHGPDVIFWHSQRDRQDIRTGDRHLDAPTLAWRRALYDDWDATLARLRADGALVVLVPPFHTQGGDPAECAGAVGLATPECIEPTFSNGALRTIYLEWAARHPDDLLVLDPADRLCPAAPCPPVLDGVNLRRDLIHFSSAGAQLLSGWLLDALPDGVFP